MRKLLYLITFLLPIYLHGQSISIVTSDTSICSGATVAFVATASGTTTPHYQWLINSSVLGTDNNMLVTDTLHNNDTVLCQLTDAAGTLITTSNSFVIHVRTKPDAGPIIGPDTVCVGTTITLTANTPGGTWLASNTHASVGNGIVTGKYAGTSFECHTETATDTIVYIAGNTCGADTATKIIIIHPQPSAGFYLGTPFSWGGPLCVGQSIPINGGIGACGQMYTTTGNAIVGGWVDMIYGNHPGTDYVYCVATNYCGTRTFGQSVTVFPKPDSIRILSTTNDLCAGAVDSLRSSPGNFQINWYNKGLLSFNKNYGSVIAVSANETGMDTITLRATNQCGYAYDTKVITVNPVPALSLLQQEVCKGNEYTTIFRSTIPGGLWSSSEPNTLNAMDGFITGLAPGTASVSYTLPTGCHTSANVEVIDCDDVIKLFPNPVADELVLHMLSLGYYHYFAIGNIIGQQSLLSGQILGLYTTVNTSLLPPGIYFLTAWGPGGRAVQRFVKE